MPMVLRTFLRASLQPVWEDSAHFDSLTLVGKNLSVRRVRERVPCPLHFVTPSKNTNGIPVVSAVLFLSIRI